MTEFLFPAEVPIEYFAHRLECLEHGSDLKLALRASEPVVLVLIQWTAGTCECIRLLESELTSRLFEKFHRHYHTSCFYFEGIHITEIESDYKHKFNCD